MHMCCAVLSHFLSDCMTMDCSPPGSSVHGILQARILEWVAGPPPGDLPDPGIKATSFMSPALAGRLFTTSATWDACISIYIYAYAHTYIHICICIYIYKFMHIWASLVAHMIKNLPAMQES